MGRLDTGYTWFADPGPRVFPECGSVSPAGGPRPSARRLHSSPPNTRQPSRCLNQDFPASPVCTTCIEFPYLRTPGVFYQHRLIFFLMLKQLRILNEQALCYCVCMIPMKIKHGFKILATARPDTIWGTLRGLGAFGESLKCKSRAVVMTVSSRNVS